MICITKKDFSRVTSVYQKNNIETVSLRMSVLMLYDGVIKFCNMATTEISRNNMEKASVNIIKAEKIISELRFSLDDKYKISENLTLLYTYIHSRLVEANMKKDKDIIEEVLVLMRELRDAWRKIV